MNALLDDGSSLASTRYEMARGSDYLPNTTQWFSPTSKVINAFIDNFGILGRLPNLVTQK